MSALGILLWPLSVLYGRIVRIRAWCYRTGLFRQHRLNKPVISVGNLTVGGTGKTPMVIWIAERLRGEGKRVGILIRGYKGTAIKDAKGSSAGRARPVQSDEADMLGARLGESVHLGVGADRVASGRMLEIWADWLILDDGFQHLRLARDVDIVLIDSTHPFGGGHVLPSGLLREPKAALARADLVMITRSEHAPAIEAVVGRFSEAPIFYASTSLECLATNSPGAHPAVIRNPRETKLRFFAFCGIGSPKAFFVDLRRWTLHIVGEAAYPDHHRYSQRDSEELERQALAAGAEALLCTEKDIFNFALAETRKLPVYSCRISLQLSDPEGFWEAMMSAVSRRRSRESK